MNFDGAWERVQQITGWRKYGELADFLGTTSQSVSGVKSRGTFPLEWAFKIAQAHGSSTDWIVAGKPTVVAETHQGYIPDQGDYVLVPRYEVAASAGGGSLIHSEQIVDYLSFKAEWVKNGLGLAVKDLALISVRGDSMETTLSNGDLILIDLSANKVEDNAVYVLQYNGVLLVKRIQRKLDGTVVIKGDNPVYEVEVLQGELVDQLHVVGRVVWCGRRM